jgi:MoaA/NifB/PqqE/SkfB family radical SAM enzyme
MKKTDCFSNYWRGVHERLDETIELLKTGKELPLRRLTIVSTTSCNLKCNYCNVIKRLDEKILSKKKVLSVIDEARSLGLNRVHLTGGECTLVPWLCDVISYLNSYEIDTTMTTNGTAGRAEEIVKAGIGQIHLSLDTYKREVNDELTGTEGAYDKTIDFARTLSLLHRKEKFSFYIHCVINRHNFMHLPEHIDFILSSFHVDGVYPMPVKKHTELVMTREDIERYHIDILPEIKTVLGKYYDDGEENEVYRTVSKIFGDNEDDWQSYGMGNFPLSMRYPCYLSLQELTLGADGNVYDCLLAYYDGVKPAGNLSCESLEKIFRKNKPPVDKIPLYTECLTGCNTFMGQFNRITHTGLAALC